MLDKGIIFTHVPNCPVILSLSLSKFLIIFDNPKSDIFIFVLSEGFSILSVSRILVLFILIL